MPASDWREYIASSLRKTGCNCVLTLAFCLVKVYTIAQEFEVEDDVDFWVGLGPIFYLGHIDAASPGKCSGFN